jgi:predicted transcriptional regulator
MVREIHFSLPAPMNPSPVPASTRVDRRPLVGWRHARNVEVTRARAGGRGGSTGTRRAAGALEADVLGALWAADGSVTPAELQTALGTGLAYNTVYTILTRLQDKGLVVRVRHSGRSGYRPVKDAAQHAADRMRTVLESGRDRAEILQRFVTSLSPADELALRKALVEAEPT